MPPSSVKKTIRSGDTSKQDPFTIIVVSNPALEAPWKSGTFVIDPITSAQAAFDACVNYIESSLFGTLPNQREQFIADPTIAPKIRLISLFITGLTPQPSCSLVAQDGASNLLVARRNVFLSVLAGYGLNVVDVAYAVSLSQSHTRASAWYTTDDDGKGGDTFTLKGGTFSHRYFNLIPGTVALHATSNSLTALHEFGHALSSYSNGSVVDLYVDSGSGLNNKAERPIPAQFDTYKGTSMASDSARDGLGYPASWVSYHCELLDPAFPAVMDNYWMAHDGIPEHCQHDRITREFLRDRLSAKISR